MNKHKVKENNCTSLDGDKGSLRDGSTVDKKVRHSKHRQKHAYLPSAWQLTQRSPYCLAVGLSDLWGFFLELSQVFFSLFTWLNVQYISNKTYVKEQGQFVLLDSSMRSGILSYKTSSTSLIKIKFKIYLERANPPHSPFPSAQPCRVLSAVVLTVSPNLTGLHRPTTDICANQTLQHKGYKQRVLIQLVAETRGVCWGNRVYLC